MWREILSWAFGFLTPAACGVCAAVGIGGIVLWFQMPQQFKWLSIDHAWAGGWLFIAATIAGGVIAWRVIG